MTTTKQAASSAASNVQTDYTKNNGKSKPPTNIFSIPESMKQLGIMRIML